VLWYVFSTVINWFGVSIGSWDLAKLTAAAKDDITGNMGLGEILGADFCGIQFSVLPVL